MNSSTPPVLLLIFNRPDLVAHSLDSIRRAAPKMLFIAADGPRDSQNEERLCHEARRVATNIDWDCEVKTLFRDSNQGCRRAVSEAITWFFSHVDSGIILEDDCVANLDFFRFAAELLEKYRADPRVMCITGDNFQNGQKRGDADYYFSIFPHCWGWATWANAWKLYDGEMTSWNTVRKQGFEKDLLDKPSFRYWKKLFDSVSNQKLDSWATVWTYSCWANEGLTATPNENLVTNVGFDGRGAHCREESKEQSVKAGSLGSPLKSPTLVERDLKADRFVEENHFKIDRRPVALQYLSKFVSRLRKSVKH